MPLGYKKDGSRRIHTPETKEKIRLANLGRKHTEEARINMSKGQKGNKNNLGNKLSTETKKKISEARLKNPTKPWLGKHLSEEHKKKLSILNSKRTGEKSSNWKGGKSFESYSTDWTKTLKRAIRERDRYTCQVCGKSQEDKALDVHHIDYNKKNCNSDNLVALCISCHRKTNGNRDYWLNYFKTK